jgi:hypothetical protein
MTKIMLSYYKITLLFACMLSFADRAHSQVNPVTVDPLIFNEISIDCEEDVMLESSVYNPDISHVFSGTGFTDCVPFDSNGQSELSYTLNNVAAVAAIRRGIGTSGFGYAIQWEIEGGHFIIGANGNSTANKVCAGTADATTVGICAESMFTGPDVEFGFNNSYLRSTIRVQWDNVASDIEPKVKVKLVVEKSNKFDLFKFIVDGLNIKVTGKSKKKYTICEKTFSVGGHIFNIDGVRSSYNCSNDSKTFIIEDGLFQEGCLTSTFSTNVDELAHAYQYRINGSSWSTDQYTYDNRFIVNNVGTTDAVAIRVTPLLLNGYRGVQFTNNRVAPANFIQVNIAEEICNNHISIDGWRVDGMSNITWDFSDEFPMSAVTIYGNIVTFNQTTIPEGRYGVLATGSDVCGDPIEVLRYFEVLACDGDIPTPLTSPTTTVQNAVVSIQGINSSTTATNKSAISNKQKESEVRLVSANPFTSELIFGVMASEPQTATLQLFSLTGQATAEQAVKLFAGENRVILDDLGHLTPGIYGYRVIDASGRAVTGKVVKR